MGRTPASGRTRRSSRDYFPHEPFCTVLLEQVSESIDVSKGQFTRQTRRLIYPLRTGPTQTQRGLASPLRSLHKAAMSNRLRSDNPHVAWAGPRKRLCFSRGGSARME